MSLSLFDHRSSKKHDLNSGIWVVGVLPSKNSVMILLYETNSFELTNTIIFIIPLRISGIYQGMKSLW